IDTETMKFHYQKHYKGYVKKLNSALRKKDYGDVELEEIIRSIGKYNKTIRNNAGGAFNHALFWKMLSPTEQKCSGAIYDRIKKDFHNFLGFKQEFTEKAKKYFGSGWIWLILTKSGSLKIMTTQNQDNPLMNIVRNGGYPLLGLDLWEHAYYLKYQNKRDEYITNFWDVVNWKFINELYLSKTKKSN
ncbi:MAG: superoxide dismutase, partial [bacterium]